jgi:hypothetical protein
VEAQFASARLGWGPSILIENAAFSPTNQAAGPCLSAGWTQLNLNANSFYHAHLRIDSFEVRQAGLRLPVSSTNQEVLSLMDVGMSVRLATNSVAVLSDGSAWFRGIRIHVNGEIRNFHAARDWKLPFSSAAQPAAAAPRLTVWEIFQKIHFTGAPELAFNFYVDGRDKNTLRTELQFAADGAQTPWGQSGALHLSAVGSRFFNPVNAPFLHATLQARGVTTPWANSRDLTASFDLSRDARTNFSAYTRLAGHDMRAAWNSPAGSNGVRVAALRWDGSFAMSSPAFVPDAFQGTLRATNAESGWGSVGAAALVLQTRRADAASADDPAWGQWNRLKPFTLDWQMDATNILTPKLKLERVAFKGGWRAPQLTIGSLEASMCRGHLGARGLLDVASREVQARAAVDFDPHQISPLLTGPVQRWISLYDWETPPSLSASARFVLPPWTNRLDVWPAESRDSLQLAGDFSVGRGAFRGLAVSSARSHFSYTNHVWNVSGLRVAGDGGLLDLDYSWNEKTHDYHFQFDSILDPAAALPLLTEPQQRVLRQVSFPDKPEAQGQVWGRWDAPERTGFAANLSTGRMVVRGESVDQLSAQLEFTNRFLRIHQLNLTRHEGRVLMPLAGIDFVSNVISMSNASSTIDPEAVRRALGPAAPPFMREVHFDSPPLVQASGSFIPGNDEGTDMRFSVQGHQFHWALIRVDSARGAIDYHVRTVVVTNVEAVLYKTGSLLGWITFEWASRGTKFNSQFDLQNINLAALARAYDLHNSKLEGMLNGHLELAAPYGARDTNYGGSGWLHLHDGLL